MELELSKKERKIARELIDKGLQEDIKRGLLELQKWKDEQAIAAIVFIHYMNLSEIIGSGLHLNTTICRDPGIWIH
jgi:hypothetical protein